jgi:hypothetical protein
LLEVDREALGEAHEQGCPHCGERLDRGDFTRKPRGEPEKGMPEGFPVRFSLCCSRDGCRRRLTPFSRRFLARRVYVGAAVVLVRRKGHPVGRSSFRKGRQARRQRTERHPTLARAIPGGVLGSGALFVVHAGS